ncbi:MAG: hypothetical protein B7C24_08560 [Bacteroidetes bacterium 4572_77]|nr:MAG: hypothetical protein B7C24_08560 [Bacteroidetes bacterium 4572_77]
MLSAVSILKIPYKAFFIALWLFLGLGVYSQTYYFENYNIQQGLPNSKIYDILQDNEGYVWVASPSGLTRFDGAHFVVYGNSHGLSEGSVRALYLDTNNHLWIGFESGLVYYKDSTAFHLLINDSINNKGEISDISENQNGDILVSSYGEGVFLIRNYADSSQREILNYKGKEGAGQIIFKTEEFSDGRIFMATSVDIMYMKADSAKFEYFRPEGFPGFFLTTCMIEDSKGNIWIGKYNGGLYKYDIETKRFIFFDHRDGLAHNWISALFEDSKGRIWVGTWGGGISLFEHDKLLVNFDNKNGLASLNIQKIVEDKEGNIFIATQEDGFQIFKGMQFLSMDENNGLPNPQIWDICEWNDTIALLATNGGIVSLKINTTKNMQVDHVFQKSSNTLVSDKIRHLQKDDYGNIWIGTALSGIQSYNTKTNTFNYDIVLNSNIPQNAKLVRDIAILHEDMFVGTVDGLLNYHIPTKKVIRISQENGLSGNDISVLYKGIDNKLWVGIRNKGLNYIDSNLITQLPKTKAINATCFAEKSKDQLYVGTNKGVFFLMKDSLVKVLDVSNGLMSNYVSALCFLNKYQLLIGSNNGISVYDFRKKRMVNYNENLGFTGIETKNNALLLRSDSTVFIGTTGGLMVFDPHYQHRKMTEPFVHIGQLKVNMKDQALIQNAEYSHNENDFLFYYHAISLSNQSDLKYQVKLEGLDYNWRNATKSTNISFSKLPAGDYIFKVKAITFDGAENKEPAAYSFTIRPPFWLTWWFLSGSLFLIIASTVFGVRYRIYLLKKEKQILEEKVVERTHIISQKNVQLVEKNQQITDSINYARRIQYATMRPESMLNQLYEEAFILYLPKDIVSGDFYWYAKKDDHVILAAADCTGHGVPGAFMSMLGIAFLNEIIGRIESFDAGAVLQKLRDNVINALNQSHSVDSTKDGMDIALLMLNKKEMSLQYAGAYNPLYLLRNQELIEYKANRMPIGVHTRDNEQFVNHHIKLQSGDQLYIFTDGYADQFGGPKGKKMNYKRFKNLLFDQQGVAKEQQKNNLLTAFNDWKDKEPQLDDVLVIGVNI